MTPAVTDGRGLLVPIERCEELLAGSGKSPQDVRDFFDVEYDCGYFATLCEVVGNAARWREELKRRFQEPDQSGEGAHRSA